MSLPFTVMTIWFARRFLADKEIPARALNFTRWILILDAFYNCLSLLYEYKDIDFSHFYTGAYRSTYIIMAVCVCLVPLILFHKKLSRSILAVFIVSILLKFGSHLEIYSITLTTLYRDNELSPLRILSSFYDRYSTYILLGIIVGIFLLIGFSFFSKRRSSEVILDENIE